MNELQKVEFEILATFVSICEKLNLRYFLVCGSALGAVKYGGFIPWDDDVDVALPRDDYEKFLKEAPRMLPDHLFLQNYRTDPQFPKVFSKLRDSRTTYIESDYKKLDINHGVFIDVFALDGYPEDPEDICNFEKMKKKFIRLTSCSLQPSGTLKSKVFRQILRILGFHKHTAKYLKQYELMICKYKNNQVFCNYGNFRGKMEITPINIYGAGVLFDFEGLTVRVPSKFEEYLTKKYGNYHEDPPICEQTPHHYYYRMSLTESYKTFR